MGREGGISAAQLVDLLGPVQTQAPSDLGRPDQLVNVEAATHRLSQARARAASVTIYTPHTVGGSCR